MESTGKMLVRWNERAMPRWAVGWRPRDVAPGEDDPARAGRVLAGQQIEERGLARPVGPDDRMQRPLLDLERDLVDRGQGPERLRETLGPNEGHRPARGRAPGAPRATPRSAPTPRPLRPGRTARRSRRRRRAGAASAPTWRSPTPTAR